MGILQAERAKYEEIWTDVPEYRDFSPGLRDVKHFLEVVKPRIGESLIDIGCGEGVAGLELMDHGILVSLLDITDAGLKEEVPRESFIQKPLWDDWSDGAHWNYGFCCDVMEHIPTEYTMLVAHRIIEACELTWFQIAFQPDSFGAAIGKPLHLTVQPFGWWLDRLKTVGEVLDARDLCGRGLFIVGKK